MSRLVATFFSRAVAPVAFASVAGNQMTLCEPDAFKGCADSFKGHFNQHASITTKHVDVLGELVDGMGMTPRDFVQSLMPPSMTVTTMSKENQASFAGLTDLDGDGTLDMEDYAVVRLLSTVFLAFHA